MVKHCLKSFLVQITWIYHFNMKRNQQKEQEFQKKIKEGSFSFSYSSLNRLSFSPQLFYKDYVLNEKEVRMDKHLIEGTLIHLLLLEPEKFDDDFIISPEKTPSAALQQALKSIRNMSNKTDLDDLDNEIIQALKNVNLYQSLKDDSKRLTKVKTPENSLYFEFLCTSDRTIIDQDTYDKCLYRVGIIKDNPEVAKMFKDTEESDFELDSIKVFNEQYIHAPLKDYTFGIKGFIDRYTIDHDKKQIIITDLKTTGKTISDFPETIEFYNYWLQAAMYCSLVIKNVPENVQNYKISFNFVVIDKYNQVYVFPVSDKTLDTWVEAMQGVLKMADYHCKQNRFDLPYKFLIEKVIL